MRLAQVAASYYPLVRVRKRTFSACGPPCCGPQSAPPRIYSGLPLPIPGRHLVLKESSVDHQELL
jgi:hypothetical protein